VVLFVKGVMQRK